MLRQILATVRGLVKHIDDAIGRIVARLDLSSTLVAFTSDHGDYAGHRGMLGKTPWLPFEDLVRVPLFYAGHGVAGWPGRARPRAELRLRPHGARLRGRRSRRARLRQPQPATVPRPAERSRRISSRAVFSCTGTPWPMVRQGKYKYCPHTDEQAAMLFDLEEDPTESVNLAADARYAEVRRDLSERLARTHREALTRSRHGSDTLTAPDHDRRKHDEPAQLTRSGEAPSATQRESLTA